MRILYLDLGMGAAGDMLAASLYELLDDDLKRSFIDKMNSLGIDGLEVCAKECSKCGLCENIAKQYIPEKYWESFNFKVKVV